MEKTESANPEPIMVSNSDESDSELPPMLKVYIYIYIYIYEKVQYCILTMLCIIIIFLYYSHYILSKPKKVFTKSNVITYCKYSLLLLLRIDT